MHFSHSLIAGVVVASQVVAAATAGTPSKLNARADSAACASAASASASYIKANPKAKIIQIPADVAYNCLKSVPLQKDPAVNLVKSLKPIAQFQSTIDYLRKPPSGYLWDPVDIPRLLDAIETKLLSKDTYQGEYDYQLDLQGTFLKARDGHFAFNGDLVNTFSWLRDVNFNVVALSSDGKSIPQVYAARDYVDISTSIDLDVKSNISPIVKINDLDVNTFFYADSNSYPSQDPDSSWNSRFLRVQDIAQNGDVGRFNTPKLYPGPTTTIEFKNGTKLTIDTKAIPNVDLTGVSTGDDMYKRFCTGQTDSTKLRKRDLAPLADLTRRQSTAGYYPEPVMADKSGVLSGYYIDNSDVAVLAVYSFLAGNGTTEDLGSFQDTTTDFFADAVKAGKTKLVIDLQGNGGGFLDLSLDLFAQLFPDVAPNGKDNMRASRGMYSIMLAASNEAELANSLDAKTDAEIDYQVVPFAYQEVITPEVKNFFRLNDYYGPNHIGGGLFTNFFQGNYTNDDSSQFNVAGITITGQGKRPKTKQPFKPENIIMLTDGICASACTTFSEKMKQQGVQVIALGGRPQTGPMQAVGGVKGSQVFESGNIEVMLELFNNKTLNTILDKAKGTFWEDFNDLPIRRSGEAVGVNGRNQFRIGDDTQTPLQFVYEAADCRIWYTPNMTVDPFAIWERVATLAFTNRKNGVIDSPYCIQDSTKHATSISGGLKTGSIGPQTLPANAKSKVSGFLLNGKDIQGAAASGGVDNNSPVDPKVATEEDDSPATSPEVLAAADTMSTVCKGYTGKEWFVELLCGAFTKQGS